MLFILHYQTCPNLNEKEPQKRWPDPVITKITINNDGKQTIETVTISDNPHRVFLRIAGSFNDLGTQRKGLENVTKQDKLDFRTQFLNDILVSF